MDIHHFGVACMGFVFGYLAYYAVRHTERFDVNMLSVVIGAVGSEALIGFFGPKDGSTMGAYGVGFLLGFISYLILALILISRGKFEDVSNARIQLAVGIVPTKK